MTQTDQIKAIRRLAKLSAAKFLVNDASIEREALITSLETAGAIVDRNAMLSMTISYEVVDDELCKEYNDMFSYHLNKTTRKLL